MEIFQHINRNSVKVKMVRKALPHLGGSRSEYCFSVVTFGEGGKKVFQDIL